MIPRLYQELRNRRSPVDMCRSLAVPSDYVVHECTIEDIAPLFDNSIDFDKAQKAWRRNKIFRNPHFEYRCGIAKKDGTPCNAPPYCWNKTYMRKNNSVRGWSPCKLHFPTNKAYCHGSTNLQA